jgi:hypothetical protein
VDELHAIALDAMRAVMNGDEEYQTRRILRWYSREFHTPLHVVEDLPLEDVYRQFFESNFEGLSEQKRLKRAAELTETDEERAARAVEEQHVEEENDDFMAALAKHTKEKAPAKEKLKAPTQKPTALKDVQPAPTMGDLPEVEMVFGDEGNLDSKEP